MSVSFFTKKTDLDPPELEKHDVLLLRGFKGQPKSQARSSACTSLCLCHSQHYQQFSDPALEPQLPSTASQKIQSHRVTSNTRHRKSHPQWAKCLLMFPGRLPGLMFPSSMSLQHPFLDRGSANYPNSQVLAPKEVKRMSLETKI